jgi:hypothetical protein
MDPRSRKDWWRNIPPSGDAPTLDASRAPWFIAHQAAIRVRSAAADLP